MGSLKPLDEKMSIGATNIADARTNLGAYTVGSNIFTLTNPNAESFLKINADNSIETLDAANFRSAIGAGTSSTSGTVTSVGLNTGTTGTASSGMRSSETSSFQTVAGYNKTDTKYVRLIRRVAVSS